MKFAKTVFALFFSFALVWTQTVFLTNSNAVEEKSSSCCQKTCSCCATPSNPAPVSPQPAAPTRTASQNDLQLVAIVAQQLLKQTVAAAPKVISSHSFSPSISAVPIFERNCSLLI